MTSIVPASQVPETFAERLETRQPGAQAMVASMTADFTDNRITQVLAEHGLPDDIFAIDYRGHTYGFAPVFIKPKGHESRRNDFIEAFPGVYTILGDQPGMFRGSLIERSHIKAQTVGNKILSLGDVNCSRFCFEDSIGAMVDFESGEFLSFLRRYVANGGNLRGEDEPGESISLSEHSEILIDYGKKGESLILSRMIDDLEKEDLSSARMSSSYIPYGSLDEILHYHQRAGKDIVFYSNSPSKFKRQDQSVAEKYFQAFNSIRARTSWVDLRPDKFNHLKAAVFTYQDGRKVAYIASHSFHELAVKAGTAEVALRTTDPEIIESIEGFMIENLEVQKAA